ncbi:hypothetical protein LG71_14180 [Pluralibacter gergoviae]|uniref:DUF924 family protein n=1 Tax=Pluralibacter gergoviae TaxID=61647 RepID=UPI0004F919AF|nr:DUF924 family protein [Pluralibacter gergoviae]AIR00970.1 hypothetical protein LG71_14180 [Pluralibacter gergoviae]
MHNSVLQFWFEEISPGQWFRGTPALDESLRKRFGDLLASARRGELAAWRDTAQGRLAEIILLDQFSRNIYRGTADAFSADVLALVLAQEAVRAGCDRELNASMRAFLYMPYMHSESALIHRETLRLFNQPGLEKTYVNEVEHKAIIDRFGRYPQRNKALGRTSTPDEAQFLAQRPTSW